MVDQSRKQGWHSEALRLVAPTRRHDARPASLTGTGHALRPPMHNARPVLSPKRCYFPWCHIEQSLPTLRPLLLTPALAASLTVAATATAYSTNTVVSDPCHEEITQRALRSVRSDLGPIDEVPADRNERALINDLPFELGDDLSDFGAASLVLANHNVDFRGNEPNALDRLAPLHGNPNRQREHCLSSSNQDYVAGSKAALEECRDFIREKVEAALGGLDAQGHVDPSARTRVRVALDIRGSVDADLPTFQAEMGQALHTIQDGFSHAYRTADHRSVVTVLNYVELVEDDLDPAVDGPPHLSPLDECHGLDTLRRERLEVATTASAEFLSAALDPTLDSAAKLARTDALLDKYFSHVDGCDAENHYCDAPEERYKNPSPGCSLAGGRPDAANWPWLGLVVLGGLALRRRHAARNPNRNLKRSCGLALLALLFSTTEARAQEEPNSAEPPPSDPVARQAVAQEDARLEREPAIPWGVNANFSGSVQNPALAAAVGGRYRLSENWLVGIDGEYNPWYAEQTSKFRRGVASAYASVIFRFPMRFERTNLRSTLQLGASRMLFDLYGVPKGTTGPFVGLSLLGLDYEIGKQLYLVINPAHIAVPIPQTSGAPFSYVQYRVTLGIQWGA